MQNCNRDALKAARNRNLEMLESCCKCGAWMDYTDPADSAGDTVLHQLIKDCWNYKEYLAEADRLGLKVSARRAPWGLLGDRHHHYGSPRPATERQRCGAGHGIHVRLREYRTPASHAPRGTMVGLTCGAQGSSTWA